MQPKIFPQWQVYINGLLTGRKTDKYSSSEQEQCEYNIALIHSDNRYLDMKIMILTLQKWQ